MISPNSSTGMRERLAATHPMLAAPRRLVGLGLLVGSLGLTSVLVFFRAILGLFR